jgi:hypothetical protein
MWMIDQIAEARIREAVDRGELDDLPGAGSPLPLEDDCMVPEELRVAYRLLKNAGCLPPEIELMREIRDVEQLLVATGDTLERDRATRRLALLRARLAAQRGEASMLLLDGDYRSRLRDRLAPAGQSAGGG